MGAASAACYVFRMSGTHANPLGSVDSVTIVYDGECPFCTGFAKLVRLREQVGTVQIENARENGPAARACRAAGLSLDEGNAVLVGDRIHHGDAAQRWLAAHSAGSSPVGWLLRTLFATPAVGRLAYPVLRGMRNAALAVKGKGQIETG